MKYAGLILVLALFFLSSHSAFAESCKVEQIKVSYKDNSGKQQTEKFDVVHKLENAKKVDCERVAFEEEFNRCYDFVNKQVALLSNIWVSSHISDEKNTEFNSSSCDFVLNVRRFEERRIAGDPGKD